MTVKFLGTFLAGLLLASSAWGQATSLSPPAVKWGSGGVQTPAPIQLLGYDSSSGSPCIVGSTATCSLATGAVTVAQVQSGPVTLSPPGVRWGSGGVQVPSPQQLVGYDSGTGQPCIIGYSATCAFPVAGGGTFASPVITGTVTGTYTLSGTLTLPSPGPFGDTTSVVLGTGAAAAQNTGTLNNVIIGNGAAPLLTSFANSVIIGSGAGAALTATAANTQSVFIGRSAGAANTSGGFNIFIGNNAGLLNNTGAESTCIGWQACAATTSGGFLNAVGTSALNAQTGTGVAMGTDALKFYNNAQPSVAFGNNAGKNTIGGGNSTYIGTSAGASWTQNSGTINSNLAIGDTAFDGNNGSISQIARNIAIGNNTMLAHSATTLMSDNIAIGHNGAQGLTNGVKNVMIGGGNVGASITSGGSNVVFGYNVASANLTTGSNNVFIGTSAALVASNVSNNIGIGTSSTPVISVTGGDVPSTSVTTIAGLQTLTGATTLSSTLAYGGVTLTNAVTGTGKMVLDTSPSLVTPVLGAGTFASLVSSATGMTKFGESGGNGIGVFNGAALNSADYSILSTATLLIFNRATGGDIEFREHNGTAQLSIAATTGAVNAAGPLLNTGIVADTATADSTACVATTGKKFLTGTGTIGICLGTSSELFKPDLAPIDVGLAEVLRLKPIKFHYDAEHDPGAGKLYYGLGAWATTYVLPSLVDRDAVGNPQAQDVLGVVPVLVRALQEKVANDNTRFTTIEQKVGIR